MAGLVSNLSNSKGLWKTRDLHSQGSEDPAVVLLCVGNDILKATGGLCCALAVVPSLGGWHCCCLPNVVRGGATRTQPTPATDNGETFWVSQESRVRSLVAQIFLVLLALKCVRQKMRCCHLSPASTGGGTSVTGGQQGWGG